MKGLLVGFQQNMSDNELLIVLFLLVALCVPALAVERDTSGRIKRSANAKQEFREERPCPSTGKTTGACPGYVIDHIQPLKKDGPDRPSNMQWQTVEAAKMKDRWE